MIDLIPKFASRGGGRVLCVGAHCDDIEIGCAASLLALQQRYASLKIDWAVLSGSESRRRETARTRLRLVRPQARGELVFASFDDGRLPAQYREVKDFFETLRRAVPAPDIVLCHERLDRHQDHRLVNEMVWNTFRNHLVLEYEIPKWDGSDFYPNVYIPITRAQATAKVRVLMSCYPSQAGRDWFTPDTFLGLMRLRGVECRSPSGLAEAFHGRKLRIGAA